MRIWFSSITLLSLNLALFSTIVLKSSGLSANLAAGYQNNSSDDAAEYEGEEEDRVHVEKDDEDKQVGGWHIPLAFFC